MKLTRRATAGHRYGRSGRSRARLLVLGLVAIFLAGSVTAAGAVWTNAFGAGERFENLVARINLIIDPPPDRETAPTLDRTPEPIAEATPDPTPTPAPTPAGSLDPNAPAPTPDPTPTPSPTPERKPVDINIIKRPQRFFASQITSEWCAPAGVQMALAVLGLADTSERFQRELVGRIDEWESRRDSHNGGWGPGAMVKALDAYGARGYEIRAYQSRGDAMLDAARAIGKTEAPVIILAWRGAHTWVMTGYRANADPLLFNKVQVSGAYILDPWYPRVSSIWGPSDPAGTYQDDAEMDRNFLRWQRPEGRYEDRDGKFILVVPTIHADEMG